MVQQKDGILGTKWPVEIIPKSGAPLKLTFEALDQGTASHAGGIRVASAGGMSVGALKGVPQNVRTTLRIKPTAGVRAFGLCVRGKGAYEGGCELRFEPAQQRVQYGSPASGRIAPLSKPGVNGADVGIEGVSGRVSPFELDLIVRHDFVDACIDNRRTIISPRPDRPQGGRLFFIVDGGEVLFEDVQIRPLV